MNKIDAEEAAPIVQRMMVQLASAVSPSGINGSAARTQISDVRVNAYVWLRNDIIGDPLNNAFVLTRDAGATWQQIETVRRSIETESPKTVGAALIVNSGIQLCLATEAELIARIVFASRQDVDITKAAIQGPFLDAEETAADDMDQLAFKNIVTLHGALINHLTATERPLPRMINYQFASILPTLVVAYRLYADASRADQVRQENKVVHPAFTPAQGMALSA